MTNPFSRTISLVIPSRHGGRSLQHLLRQLDDQLLRDRTAGNGLDVVVVLDGSAPPVPRLPDRVGESVKVEIARQPHRGLAAARNLGLRRATGELVWFLDDDEVPVEGALRARRARHEDRADLVVVGPNILVRNGPGDAWAREWFHSRHAALERSGAITQFDQFSAANTSGPAELFRRLDGFDERFVGWGYEDLEFGYRLLQQASPIVFEARAGALHGGESRDIEDIATRFTESGRNLALLLELHPGASDTLVPAESAPSLGALRTVWRSSPRSVRFLIRVCSRWLLLSARIEWRATRGRSDRLIQPLIRSCVLEGVIDAHPEGHAARRRLGSTTARSVY
jgi:GT2 family glycosyltransferase